MMKSALLSAAATLVLTGAASAHLQDDGTDWMAYAGTYDMDDSHAVVTWSIQHLGLSQYTAQFETVTGQLTIDAENLSNSSVIATIAADSVDTDYTGEKDFDAEVEGFLGAAENPEITFASTGLELTGERTGVLTGDLTLAGVTQPVELNVILTGALESHPFVGRPALGFTATGSISRSNFNFELPGPLQGGLGDEVNVVVTAEFIKSE